MTVFANQAVSALQLPSGGILVTTRNGVGSIAIAFELWAGRDA
jgi:hypothetical protein